MYGGRPPGAGARGAGRACTAWHSNRFLDDWMAGAGGTISPSSATVNAGGTTTFTVTPKTGYFVSGFTGCGADGSLVGTTFTTGTINAACTVTASFAAAFAWFGGSNAPGASGVYGTQGVAAATNVPRARDGGVTWTDSNGNLWLFGGSIRPRAANGPGSVVPTPSMQPGSMVLKGWLQPRTSWAHVPRLSGGRTPVATCGCSGDTRPMIRLTLVSR
jgi:hypothetical protein